MDEYEKALNEEYNKILKNIEYRARVILEEEIDKQVYQKYNPTEYHRTYSLRNSVKTEIRNGILYVYINNGNMHYEDFRGNDVSSSVPYWINYGHNSNNYSRFMLFQYPSRGFIQTAKARIEEEFEVEVIMM